jgi:amino acid transporter
VVSELDEVKGGREAMTMTSEPKATSGGPALRRNALGFPQLLAQSVALISPTMTAVLIIPLAFSIAGDASWFSYLFATIMLLFVVGGLNQFAKRSTTTGSMYAYAARGLGAAAGVMTGWALVWCYFFIGTAGLCGFALMSQQFLDGLGVHGSVTPLLFFVISGAVGFFIAFKDVRLSAVLMLVLEGLSVACILALSAVILFKHGFHVDTQETSLHGFTLKTLDFSVVVCIFSLVGFEAASTMGGEARNPLKTVPKAVVWSLILTGLFMVVMCYVEVLGASHSHLDLASLGAPLQTLSSAYGVSFFKVPVSLGGMVSFFALTLSCVNSGTRIVLPLAKHGFVTNRLHRTHATNLTPHAAIGAYYVALLVEAFIWHLSGTSALTMFNDAGTLAATGFLFAYFMTVLAAPIYLRKLGELKAVNVAVSVAGVVLLFVPLVGLFYPLPAFPVDIFPAIFAVFMILGGTWLLVLNRRVPGTLTEIEASLEASLNESMSPASDVEEGARIGLEMPGLAGVEVA